MTKIEKILAKNNKKKSQISNEIKEWHKSSINKLIIIETIDD
jgi:hypothetical protein